MDGDRRSQEISGSIRILMYQQFITKYKLGIVYKDRKVINHRSALKVFLNPFLRVLGLQIGTYFDNKRPKGIRLMKCPPQINITFSYDVESPYRIVKKRTWI